MPEVSGKPYAGVVPPLRDAALAAAVAVGTGLAAGAMSATMGIGDPLVTGALVAVEAVPLAWRHRAPRGVLAATLLLGWAVAVVPATATGLLVAAVIATYTAATCHRWEVAAVAGLLAGVGSPLAVVGLLDAPFPFQFTVVPEPEHLANALVGSLAAFAGATLLGTSVRARRAHIASVEEHAARVERERAEREHRAVLEERARIARELHDVAAHHLSGLVLQAGALERTVARDPGQAAILASEVREGGAQALTSMRRLVGLLRAADDEPETRGSRPSLADLDDLLDAARDDGLEVTLTAEGTSQLPRVREEGHDEVELAVYRIVQEALSNARRHAPGATVAITVAHGDDGCLDIEVVDDGGRASPEHADGADGGGLGLIGMRERVQLLGGTLEVGPRQPRGWRIHARLPIGTTDDTGGPRR